MENVNMHLIKQQYDYYSQEGTAFDFITYIQKLAVDYYDTLNNEKEKEYLNNEDIRLITEEKYLLPNEFCFNIYNKYYLHIGACNRELFFKLNGSCTFLKRELNLIETLERNELIKQQWIRKFKLANVLKEINEHPIKTIYNVNVKSKEKYLITDLINEKEYVLMIKPVNDSAITINNELFVNNSPLLVHICEIVANICYFQKPVKVLYVGKNNSEKYKEFNCGIRNGVLLVDGVEYLDFNVQKIFEDTFQLQESLNNNSMVPMASYIQEELLDQEQTSNMFKYKIINSRTAQDLYAGIPYTSFQCKSCKYKDLCRNVGTNIIKMDDEND